MATKQMRSLTQNDIEKAFKKTVDETEVPAGSKLVLVTEDLYQRALSIPKECFVYDEPLGKSIGIQWSDEFESLWLHTFEANLSIILVNEDNGEIMGMRATKLIKKGDHFDLDSLKDEKLRRIIEFMSYGVTEFFNKYGIEEAFHFLGLGVAKKYRRRGLGKFLMQTAVKFLGNLGINPYYIKGEGTSNFSKKIYENCHFDIVMEYPFDEYKKDGNVVFDNTAEHKSMKVYGICSSKNPI
ncbi:uncharacterized protein LOC123563083 [Mercenaria mercenaria]|uniref:uncharacterized protein LOC123563083 n=1 Tax=Mercenaria mercenaria TaxID=6596 RepID=UPI001E1DC6A1|nr:uncharacterized protein LOC123563083 [Mercenaria mercenaria]